ncbi:segregation and condensation protein A [Auraticoccus monumenti]|uniref:Segregation and condensation protein A n=1 Tax=Auraticoccus monumenti TaxID=675864 RepID=A0A1G7CUG1_9ACTN|nr:segregation/condensation protein A [Auraticoccus monumenti]SDE42863.1 condensin subunit ScpA [Auraticoccus monumenti]
MSRSATADRLAGTEGRPTFNVRLDNFEGPFDLLLQLISRHRMDVTEVALSRVTDEFIAHIKAAGSVWDLEQTSQFVLVAATLLDLKAARLLPQGEVEDPEDLALLEARDLLFARLLQYRAFKQVAAWLEDVLTDQGRRFPRPGGLEDRYARLLPEVTFASGPERLAVLAARAMTPRPIQQLSLAHLHAPQVSVREQASLIVARLRRSRAITFRSLTGDADRMTTVARFLALLELYRERAVAFEQVDPLGELTIRWVGSDSGELDISDEFDEAPVLDDGTVREDGTPPEDAPPAGDGAHEKAGDPRG